MPDWSVLGELLRPFGDQPIVVKDYVKSRKHEWEEACYIPDASDRTAVERVAGRFLDLQGSDLEGGLVFREFVRFAPLARGFSGADGPGGIALASRYQRLLWFYAFHWCLPWSSPASLLPPGAAIQHWIATR